MIHRSGAELHSRMPEPASNLSAGPDKFPASVVWLGEQYTPRGGAAVSLGACATTTPLLRTLVGYRFDSIGDWAASHCVCRISTAGYNNRLAKTILTTQPADNYLLRCAGGSFQDAVSRKISSAGLVVSDQKKA